MTDRPLSLSEPMIRALVGHKKTQHRSTLTLAADGGRSAPVDPAAEVVSLNGGEDWRYGQCHIRTNDGLLGPYPLGLSVGDRLWVREDWQAPANSDERTVTAIADFYRRALPKATRQTGTPPIPILFPADGATRHADRERFGRVRAHRTLPRIGSRFTLIVTDIHLHRLHTINEAEAAAEGVDQTIWDGVAAARDYSTANAWFCATANAAIYKALATYAPAETILRRSYQTLWDFSHREANWDANPWVVCRTFTCLANNIDALPYAA